MKRNIFLIAMLVILAVCSISAQNNNARYTPPQQVIPFAPTKSTTTPVKPLVDAEQLANDIQMKQDIINNGGNEIEPDIVMPENKSRTLNSATSNISTLHNSAVNSDISDVYKNATFNSNAALKGENVTLQFVSPSTNTAGTSRL